MRKDFLNGNFTEKEVVLTIRVPNDFDHDDERMLDDEIAALLFKQGWELVDSKEYRDIAPVQERHSAFDMSDVLEGLSITDPELDSNGIPVSDSVWICVYRDTLGFGDDNDNLTHILVPTDWLISQLEKEGQPIQGWFDEYTADSTDRIASAARLQGKILDCSHPGIKTALLQQPDWFSGLDEIDQDCVEQYTFLLGRPLASEEEYKEIDAQVDEMILEWENPDEFFAAYPVLKKYAATQEREEAEILNGEQLIGTLVDYDGYYCEVISVDEKTVFLQNVNNDMHFELSYSAFQQQTTPIVKEDNRFPLQNYDDAFSYLCEVLNRHAAEVDSDDVRTPIELDDFIPIFKSTNYFGIYCYNTDHYYSGENEYYLVNRNTGEHKMVLGESFEFIGQNLLDCMKDEQILNVANTEWLQYLVDFSLNNVQGIVPIEELGGLAVLQTALRAEKMKETNGYYPKPSLADQIGAATNRKEQTAPESVISVAHFSENTEVENAVMQSDVLRRQALDLCHNIPGYASMSQEDKNQIYDLAKKAVASCQGKDLKFGHER